MIQTVEAIIDEDGTVHLLEQVEISKPRRALVTILNEDATEKSSIVSITTLLSEESLARDWSRPEEDEAWSHLQQER